jgi:rhodanese-related sulfurtransferase
MRQQASVRAAWKVGNAAGAVVIDLRTPADFARGHLIGALSLPFSTKGLGQRLAVVVEPDVQIKLLASDPAISSAACAQLRDIYQVIGVVDNGKWNQADLPKEALRDLSVQTLAAAPPSADLTILDVREPMEWQTGFAPGAVLISLGSLAGQLDSIARECVVAVVCEAGTRSSTAASLLRAAGFPRVATVSEGMSGYRRAGLPLAFPEARGQG